MCAHILVAEDDQRQAEIVRSYLAADRHDVTVTHDGRTALDEARRRRPDLLVLDVMMPGLDGLNVCRLLRQESSVPILMLTARSEVDDLLLGLDLGADDYLTKPYDPRELTARVRTLLRRFERAQRPTQAVLRVGPLAVDPTRRTVAVDGRAVDCTPGEFAILAALAAQPDRVYSRSQLLECISRIERASTERAIDTHVLNLRRKIEENPRRPALLVTVYGVGYKLTDPTPCPERR